MVWTGGRVVEGARLESVFRLKPNAGSNPALSAIFLKANFTVAFWTSLYDVWHILGTQN